MNVLFVCKGNICTSPIAEAFLKKKYEENSICGIVDSAGFEPVTINEPPHDKAIEAAKKHKLELTSKSRLFMKKDFDRFEKIYAMDTLSYTEVKYLARNKSDELKIDYFMNVMHPGTNKFIPDLINAGNVNIDTVVNTIDKITNLITKQASMIKSDA